MDQLNSSLQWLLYKGKTYAIGVGLLGYIVSVDEPNLYMVLAGIVTMQMTLRHGLSKNSKK